MFGVCVGGVLIIAGVATLFCHRRCHRQWLLSCAFRRLRATPEQRTELTALVEHAHSRLQGMKNRVEGLRGELADAIVREPLDNGRFERLEAQLFETAGELSQLLRESTSQLHRVLNPEQRVKFGEWVREHKSCHGHCC